MTTDTTVKFLLYVAGEAPNSRRALANLSAFCERHLPQRHNIEVIDVFKTPERALQDSMFLTPALVVSAPLPARTLIGDLSEPSILLEMLGLESDGR